VDSVFVDEEGHLGDKRMLLVYGGDKSTAADRGGKGKDILDPAQEQPSPKTRAPCSQRSSLFSSPEHARAAASTSVDTLDKDLSSDSEAFTDDSCCGYGIQEVETDDEEIQGVSSDYRHFEATFPLSEIQVDSMTKTACAHANCSPEACTYVPQPRKAQPRKAKKSAICEHNRKRTERKVVDFEL